MEHFQKSMFTKNAKEPTFIIAEMAWAHDGLPEKAKTIMKGAKEAGADAISVHITNMPAYMVKHYKSLAGKTLSEGREDFNIYAYQDAINIKDKDWPGLFSYAKKLGLAILAMPNDHPSIALCRKLKPDAHVIHASCFTDEDFVSAVGKEKKPVILRMGGATIGEIERTVRLLQHAGASEVVLLHGIQLYPTNIGDTHIGLVPALRDMFGLNVGLADHVDATSPLASIIPLLAIPLGITIIEKHITHDRSLKGEDIEAALNPDEFKTFVSYVRAAEKAMGVSSFRDLSQAEIVYRGVSRKKTVAAKDIKKGEKITKTHLAFKRSDTGAPMEESKYLIERTAKEEVKKDEGITWERIV